MKKVLFLLAFLVVSLVVKSQTTTLKSAQQIKNVASPIDLGLSVKWASCNLGASKPEELGDYYAWGETTSKDNFTWETYKLCKQIYPPEHNLIKYCLYSGIGYKGLIDNKKQLELKDDAANVSLGSNWRIPTYNEFQELVDSCKWEWIAINKVAGYKVIGPNGNSIFLPASGEKDGTSLYNVGFFGHYWTSTLSPGYGNLAWKFEFGESAHCRASGWNRYGGITIRPVKP